MKVHPIWAKPVWFLALSCLHEPCILKRRRLSLWGLHCLYLFLHFHCGPWEVALPPNSAALALNLLVQAVSQLSPQIPPVLLHVPGRYMEMMRVGLACSGMPLVSWQLFLLFFLSALWISEYSAQILQTSICLLFIRSKWRKFSTSHSQGSLVGFFHVEKFVVRSDVTLIIGGVVKAPSLPTPACFRYSV